MFERNQVWWKVMMLEVRIFPRVWGCQFGGIAWFENKVICGVMHFCQWLYCLDLFQGKLGAKRKLRLLCIFYLRGWRQKRKRKDLYVFLPITNKKIINNRKLLWIALYSYVHFLKLCMKYLNSNELLLLLLLSNKFWWKGCKHFNPLRSKQ